MKSEGFAIFALLCLAVVFLVVGPTMAPAPHTVYAQAPPPGATCVMEAVQQASGFSFPLSCEDRARFTTPALTGSACTAPPTGITLYTKLPDGTCLPLVIVPSAGFVAELPFGMAPPTGQAMTAAQLALVLRSLPPPPQSR